MSQGGRDRQAQAFPLPRMVRRQTGEIPEVFRKWEQKARTSKKEWKWQRGVVEHHLSGSQWNRGHFSMRKWESERHMSWGWSAEGFKGHVATDGRKVGAYGWAVVRWDYDEELATFAWDVRLVGRRNLRSSTIKRAELTAFLGLPKKKVIGSIQSACRQQRNC